MRKEEHFLPHASNHCMGALPGNTTQPLAGLGPPSKSVDKSYPASTTFWLWEKMGRGPDPSASQGCYWGAQGRNVGNANKGEIRCCCHLSLFLPQTHSSNLEPGLSAHAHYCSQTTLEAHLQKSII